MKFNLIFLLLFSFSFFRVEAIESLNYEELKQQDELYNWSEALFDALLSFEEEGEYIQAELLCDSIINNLWREPNTSEEYDVLTKVYAYKGFYSQDKEHIVDANNAFETSLKYFELSSKINENYLAIIYPKLGNNYTRLGDNDKAILIHQKMINYAKEKKNYKALVQAFINLSISIENKGNTNLAKETLLKAIPYLDEVSSYRKAIVYSNLGSYSYSKGTNFKEAKDYLFKAEKLLNNIEADSYFLAGIYRGLGEIYKDENQSGKAISYFNKSIAKYKTSNYNRSREIAKTYVLLSKLSSNKEVKNILDSAYYHLTQNHLVDANISQVYAENTFIEIFKECNKQDISNDEKLRFYQLIQKAEKDLRNEFLFESSKYDILKENRNHLEAIMSLSYDSYSKNKQDKYVVKAFEFLEASKSVVLFENLRINLDNQNKKDFNLFKEKRKELKDEYLQAQLSGELEKESFLKSEIDQLKFDFSIKNKNFERIIEDENNSFDLISFINDFLKEDELLLSYFVGELYVYVVLISKNRKEMYRFENDVSFKEELQNFKSSFNFKNRYQFDKTNANNLAKKLVPFSIESFTKMILITDKGIENIPFEALILNNKYLIEQIETYYAFSSQILNHKSLNNEANAKLIAFAPVFKNDKVKWLRKSKEEIEEINKYLDSDNYLEAEANSTNFLKYAPAYELVHISTHAQINQKIQAASIDFYDKSLFFNQIVDEKFNTKLLVLSACETGIGENKIGEGSMSLSRAFAYANIPTSISSLWKVNEESSVYILSHFYKYIGDKSISQALRKSKLEYLSDVEIAEEKKMPYYWASYVLVGKDNTLNIEKPKSMLKMSYGIIVILLLSLLASLCLIKMKRSR